MATNIRNKSRRCRNQHIYQTYEHLNMTQIHSGQQSNHYDGVGPWPTEQIKKMQKSKHSWNLSTSKNYTNSERAQKKIYDAYSHRRTIQIQKMPKSKCLWNLWTTKNNTNSKGGTKTLMMAMATDPKAKQEDVESEYSWNLWTLKNGTNSELGTEKYLRWLWTQTHKTIPEDAEIKIFMKPLQNLKITQLKNREKMTKTNNPEAAEI